MNYLKLTDYINGQVTKFKSQINAKLKIDHILEKLVKR